MPSHLKSCILLILGKEPTAQFEEIAELFITTFPRKANLITQPGLVDGLVGSQKKIISLIQQYPKISIGELKQKIGISRTAIDNHIKKLKSKNILERIGNAKSGYWKVNI